MDAVKPHHVLDALWKKRSLVKTWAMRGTLHLFSADEFPLYAAAMQSRDHWRKPHWLKAFGVPLGEMEAIIKGIHDVLDDGRHLTRVQLSGEVASRVGERAGRKLSADSWGALLKPAAAAGVLAFGPNVGRNVSFVRPDRWLANWRDVDPLEAIQDVLRMFVHMHGPTRPENFVHWWGRATAATKRLWRSMDAEFEEVDVEGDRAWVLVADADAIARIKPDRRVRLLPNFRRVPHGVPPPIAPGSRARPARGCFGICRSDAERMWSLERRERVMRVSVPTARASRAALFALVGLVFFLHWTLADPSYEVSESQDDWSFVLGFRAAILLLGFAIPVFAQLVGRRLVFRMSLIPAGGAILASLSNLLEDGLHMDWAFFGFVLGSAIILLGLLAPTGAIALGGRDSHRYSSLIPAGTMAALIFYVTAGGILMLATWLAASSVVLVLPTGTAAQT
jgi:hypothetical protein